MTVEAWRRAELIALSEGDVRRREGAGARTGRHAMLEVTVAGLRFIRAPAPVVAAQLCLSLLRGSAWSEACTTAENEG